MAQSTLGRVVRYVNFAIAAVLVAALAAVWWFAWRPLPRKSGSVSAPVAGRVSILRDRLGVPHIRGASLEEVLFAQGYATAQERLFQMDGLRRLEAGDLAEIVGRQALEGDREARRLRIRRIAEEAAVSASPADRAALAAYARGVNEYIRTHLDRLPLEFSLLGYHPRPWSVVDSIIVGLHMFRTLTTTWESDLARRGMQAAAGGTKAGALFPPSSGGEAQPGSNAWVVSGARTASGKPVLSNDMHLDWSLPGVWFMVHLQAPGLHVAGVSLPGTPGVIAGHNERIAWGMTNLGYDVQDLYIEQFDDRTGRYVFRGGVEQARREREIIRVKGAAPHEMVNWVTRHGPLVAAEGAERISLRWVASEAGAFAFPFLDINRARGWREFTAALERFPGPGSNFLYADVDGNIGYHAAGRLPVRKTFTGDAPVDGSSGEHEWEGWIPFRELPSAFNPPDGILVSSNQNPFPEKYPYAVNGSFAPHYRASQVRRLLEAKKGWTAADMLAVQKDVYSGFSHFLARQMAAAWERHKAAHPNLEAAATLLGSWNGQMEQDLAAPLIAALAYQHLHRALAESAAGSKAAWDRLLAPAAIERLLRERPGGWFTNWDDPLLEALRDAADEAGRMQGRDMGKWRYGNWLVLRVQHPVTSRVPLVGRYFDIGPAPGSGSGTTVKQTTARMGPSMRMNIDLADWERSLLNVPFGQSGHALSRNYKDQWPRFYTGESWPIPFAKMG